MAKKVKDYYDLAYAKDLSRRLQAASPAFDGQKFSLLLEKDLEELEFSQRQELLAKSIKGCLPLSYQDSLKVFEKILGPEFRGWSRHVFRRLLALANWQICRAIWRQGI